MAQASSKASSAEARISQLEQELSAAENATRYPTVWLFTGKGLYKFLNINIVSGQRVEADCAYSVRFTPIRNR